MFAISDDEYNKDQSTIPVFIILAVVGYYFIGRYDKIPCRTSSLSRNTYITELLEQMICKASTHAAFLNPDSARKPSRTETAIESRSTSSLAIVHFKTGVINNHLNECNNENMGV